MTKIEYKRYIASEGWRKRRDEFVRIHNSCARCGMPRWLAEIAYDQDINVHHKSYESLGNEDWEHLEPLCRRCHEIEKFGRSDLREPKTSICENCGSKHWNPYSDNCEFCYKLLHMEIAGVYDTFDLPLVNHPEITVGHSIITLATFKKGIDGILALLEYANHTEQDARKEIERIENFSSTVSCVADTCHSEGF